MVAILTKYRLCIDADSLYFKICYKTKEAKEIEKLIDQKLDEVIHECWVPGEIKIAVKGNNNYRHLLYDKYKANRRPLDDEMKEALTHAHKYLVREKGAIAAHGMEADDLVSIWAHEVEGDAIVAGIDKDLLQIPAKHYNFDKKTFTDINEDEGHLLLMKQCLTGDSCDNIPGIKGIGPKKAEKILAGVPYKRRYRKVVGCWNEHKAGSPKLSYTLLRMLTSWEDYERIQAQVSSKSSDS